MYRESRVAQPSAAQVRALPKLRTSGSAFGPRRLPSFSTVMLGASPRQSKLNLACPATPKGGGNRPVVGGLRPAMLKAIGKSIDRLAQNGRTAMRGNDAAEDQAPERRRDLAEEPVEQVRRVLGLRLQLQAGNLETYLGTSLRPGLTVKQAAERYSALLSPELYHLLIVERRWATRQYASWVTELLDHDLLG